MRAEWCEQDSIMGDYMQVVNEYQAEDEKPIELHSVLGDQRLPRQVSSDTWLTDPIERDTLLREAAMLGLDLLSGEDGLPHESTLSSS